MDERRKPQFLPAILSCLMTVLILAGASLAGAAPGGLDGLVRRARSVVFGAKVVVDEAAAARAAEDGDGTENGTGTEDGTETDGDGTDEGSGSEGGTVTHTAEECQAALAVGQDALDSGTGLLHAITVVEANCEKNPQAPGLLNALQHLVENQGRNEGQGGGGQGQGQGQGGGGGGQGQGGGEGQGQGGGEGQGQGGGGQPADHTDEGKHTGQGQ